MLDQATALGSDGATRGALGPTGARAELEQLLANLNPSLLTLDPGVPVPDCYEAIDTHQHPGNLHGDALAAGKPMPD